MKQLILLTSWDLTRQQIISNHSISQFILLSKKTFLKEMTLRTHIPLCMIQKTEKEDWGHWDTFKGNSVISLGFALDAVEIKFLYGWACLVFNLLSKDMNFFFMFFLNVKWKFIYAIWLIIQLSKCWFKKTIKGLSPGKTLIVFRFWFYSAGIEELINFKGSNDS